MENHIEFKNTANKDGPCGLNSGKIYGYNGIISLSPGPQTFVWKESITHTGAPYPINLLNSNKNYTLENAKWSNHWITNISNFYTTDTGKNLYK